MEIAITVLKETSLTQKDNYHMLFSHCQNLHLKRHERRGTFEKKKSAHSRRGEVSW